MLFSSFITFQQCYMRISRTSIFTVAQVLEDCQTALQVRNSCWVEPSVQRIILAMANTCVAPQIEQRACVVCSCREVIVDRAASQAVAQLLLSEDGEHSLVLHRSSSEDWQESSLSFVFSISLLRVVLLKDILLDSLWWADVLPDLPANGNETSTANQNRV